MQRSESFDDDFFIRMEDALRAYLEAMELPVSLDNTQRDDIAGMLARLMPLYAPSYDSTGPRPLTDAELSRGRFFAGGRDFVFRDGRAPIARVLTTREALYEAITLLKASE